MSSEQNNSTSFPPSEPKLCSNGCGFFGSPSNMNLCSKCYRNLRAEEDQNAVAKAAVKKSLKLPSPSVIAPEQKQILETKPDSVETAVVTAEPSSAEQNEAEPSSRKNEEQEKHDMGSEKNNSITLPPSELKLCANGCGFFGSPANMNLCSKCYKSLHAVEDRAEEESLKIPSSSLKTKPASAETTVVTTEPSSGTIQDEAEPSKPTQPIRCFSCKKRVGVLGFKCKCGRTFCGSHRYPEEHDCKVDFKETGREAIAKANPVVKADKVERI